MLAWAAYFTEGAIRWPWGDSLAWGEAVWLVGDCLASGAAFDGARGVLFEGIRFGRWRFAGPGELFCPLAICWPGGAVLPGGDSFGFGVVRFA